MSLAKITYSSHTKLQSPLQHKNYLLPFNSKTEGVKSQKNSSNKWHHQKIGKSILKTKLKQIIAKNVQYFTNKIQIPETFKPNDYSLKLPGKTPITSYKSEYLKKLNFKQEEIQKKFNKYSLPLNYQLHKQNQKKMSFQTNYQKQFVPIKIENVIKKQKRKNKENQFVPSNQAPNFMDTHNHREYKNWGPGSMMPSMRPQNHPAITDMPFKATTMYKNEFHEIKCPKSKLVIKEQTFPKSVDLWMASKTSYGKQFTAKPIKNIQQGYYPQHHLQQIQGQFKSTTQYTGSYVQFKTKTEQMQKKSSKKIKSVAQLQKLIMDL